MTKLPDRPRTEARKTARAEIIARVADWAGGQRQAHIWYRTEPIPAFGGLRAEALVNKGLADAVRDYLDRIGAGRFA
jgi:hypothetical protein